MNESDVKTLERGGLTRAQAVIYLTLLEIGQTKIGLVIEKSRLQSSVVHNNINQLIEKGLINFVLKGKIKHYSVAEPDMFINYLEEEKKKIDENQEEIKKILPRLRAIKEDSKNKVEVEVYKGRKGFKTAFTESYSQLEEEETVSFLAMPSEYQEDKEIQDIFLKLNLIAREKNCSFQGIGPKQVKKLWSKIYTKEKKYDLRYTEEDFPWDINIMKESILLSLWGEEPIVIRVKDKKFRKHAQKYFDAKWKQAKK